MTFRVVKQLYPAPSSSVVSGSTINDPAWASRNMYIWSSSDMQLWEFDNKSDADTKAAELSGSDSSNRLYKVIEI